MYTMPKRKRLIREAWGDVKDEISPVSLEPAKYAVHAWLMEHGHLSGGIKSARKKWQDPDTFWSKTLNQMKLFGYLDSLVWEYSISIGRYDEWAEDHGDELSLGMEGDSVASIRETVEKNNSVLSGSSSVTAGTQIGQNASQEYLESQKDDEDGYENDRTEEEESGLALETVLLLVLGAAAVYLIMKK